MPLLHALALPEPATDPSHSTLYLVCPTSNVINTLPQPKVTPGHFPLVVATHVRGLIFDDKETFLQDVAMACTCLTELPLSAISAVYASAAGVPNGSYTKLRGCAGPGTCPTPGAFVGYLATRETRPGAIEDAIVVLDAFGRISNGNGGALFGSPPAPGTNKR